MLMLNKIWSRGNILPRSGRRSLTCSVMGGWMSLKSSSMVLFRGNIHSTLIPCNHCISRHFDRASAKVGDSPRHVLFAQLLPHTNKKTCGLVKSVLGNSASWHYSPGAKKIDVISRVVFPATFAGLNIIYWSYYLARADSAGKEEI